MKRALVVLYCLIIMGCYLDNNKTIYVKNNTQNIISYTFRIFGGWNDGTYDHKIEPFEENRHEIAPNAYFVIGSYQSKIPGSVDIVKDGNIYNFYTVAPIDVDANNMTNENVILFINGLLLPDQLTPGINTAIGQVTTRSPVFSAKTLENFPLLVTSTFDGSRFLLSIR